jgi:hypothetical protein
MMQEGFLMKRWLAIILAVLLALSTAAVAFADDNADGDAVPINTAQEFSFDTTTANWGDFSYVGFHIWEIDGDPGFKGFDWGAKKERGTDADKDGVWTYDFQKAGLTLKDGAQYAVVFYNNKGSQTYNLLFDTTCYGDTAYCDLSTVYENPEDSSKTAVPAFWSKQDPTVNGPELCVTSIGNVTGTCVPRGITRAGLFDSFLENTLDNARTFSGLSDQALIDNLGANLGLTKNEVAQTIALSGKDVAWDESLSPLSGGVAPYTVDVKVVSGKGSVLCSEQGYYSFEWLTISAQPEEGYRFDGWEIEGEYAFAGEGSLENPEVTISVKSDLVVKAKFVPVEISKLIGDADGDGRVTILDATRIQRYMAKLVEADQVNMAMADTDGDTKVTILDATRIQRVLANLCDWEGNPVTPQEPTTEYEGQIVG